MTSCLETWKCKGQYAIPVNTARVYGLYLLYTGCIDCSYIRVDFLTPVHTAPMYGCQKCARIYGP